MSLADRMVRTLGGVFVLERINVQDLAPWVRSSLGLRDGRPVARLTLGTMVDVSHVMMSAQDLGVLIERAQRLKNELELAAAGTPE